MTPKILSELETKLREMRAEIEKQEIDISRLQSEKLTEDYETASLIVDQTMVAKLLNRKTLYLRKIDEALGRIKNGYYGECDACSEDINPKRLQARPTTTHCISCKEADERRERKLNHTGISNWDSDETTGQ